MFDRELLTLPGMKRALALLVVGALCQAATLIVQTLALSGALSAAWAGASFEECAPSLAIFLGAYLANALVAFAMEEATDRFATQQSTSLRAQLLEATFVSQAGVSRNSGSAFVSTMAIEGINQVETYLRSVLPKMARVGAITLPILICTYVLDWVSGIILTLAFPVIVLFMILIGRMAQERATSQFATYRLLANHFIDSLRGLHTLKLFGVAQAHAERVFEKSEQFRKATMKTMGTATLSSAVLDLIGTLSIAAVSIMLGIRLLNGQLDLFTGLAVLVISPEYFKPIRQFAGDFHATLDGKNSLSAITRLIDAAQQGYAHETPIPLWNESSSLELKGVTFSYPNDADYGSSMRGRESAMAAIAQTDGQPANNNAAQKPGQSSDSSQASASSSCALKNVSFKAHGFMRIGIVGASGSGKSTLADILSGFAKPSAGTIEVDGKELPHLQQQAWQRQVAYIPQEPHLFNTTLRDNITFYNPQASDDEIMEAVRALGLADLVNQLESGLDTPLGEGGRKVSGGEAHRIALARIVLAPDKRILVFDEPTSHLDIETEMELKTSMLPLMEGKLVFFATHQLHWLASMDYIIELDDGTMARQGGAEQFNTKTSAVELAQMPIPDDVYSPRSTGEKISNPQQSPAAARSGMPAPTSGKPRGALSRYPWLAKHLTKSTKLLAGAFALGLINVAFGALLMFSSGALIGLCSQPETTLLAIMTPMAFVQLFGLGKPASRYVERLVSHDWVFRITSSLRKALYESAVQRDETLRSRTTGTTGDYLGLLAEDIGHLQNLFLRVALPWAIAVACSLLAAIAFAIRSAMFGALAGTALLAVSIGLPALALVINKVRATQEKKLVSDGYTLLLDNVIGARDWTLAGRGTDFCERCCASYEELSDTRIRLHRSRRSFELAIIALFGILIYTVAWWAMQSFPPVGATSMNANLIIACVLGFAPLADAYVELPESAIEFHAHADSLERLDRALAPRQSENEPPSSTDNKAKTVALKQTSACTATEDRPAIELDSVTFAFEDEEATLENVNVAIPRGQRVALLGRSGVGKSTLLSLVRGARVPSSGEISVLGNAPHLLAVPHETVGVIEQNPHLFDDTVRNNITLERPGIDDARVLDALETVGLSQLIRQRGGLDCMLGEAGMRLSGGQRQRIALARVLIDDAPIVLLDEPTTGLDPSTEHEVVTTMLDALTGKTIIMATHHLQEIGQFDRVLFLKDGRLAFDGKPDQLSKPESWR